MTTYGLFWLGMASNSKTGGGTPCQFDSDRPLEHLSDAPLRLLVEYGQQLEDGSGVVIDGDGQVITEDGA